ncbi:MAG: FecR domain-containing protein [Cyclobacteriaceae bacterium]|nr:FecR domain-containing protein [Cyclobacteriaceae bacterium]
MDKQPKHIDYNLIARFLAGEATSSEAEFIGNWRQEEDENEKFFNQCQKIFDLDVTDTAAGDVFDTDRAWTKVRSQLENRGPSNTTKVIPLDQGNHFIRNRMYYLSGIAASLIIGMVWLFGLRDKTPESIMVASGPDIETVFLPDSSKVVLAAHSSVEYKNDYGQVTRKVWLEGDAYFDVVRNEQSPFEVILPQARVSVLGTAFLIESKKDQVVVSVETGKVNLAPLHSDTTGLVLVANEKGSLFTDSQQLRKEKPTSMNYMYWANHRLSYRQMPLPEIFDELSGIFGVDFNIEAEGIGNCRLSGVFRDQDIDTILKNMALSTPFEYIISANRITITQASCVTP